MRKNAKSLRDQVKALEQLSGLSTLDEAAALRTNGGAGSSAGTPPPSTVPPPIKLRRGSGGIAFRRGSGAVAVIVGKHA